VVALTGVLKELATNSKLESEVVLRPRLEPFVKAGLHRGCAHAASWRKKKGGGNGMHNVWIIETLEHPISLHTLPSFPLTFFFRMAFSVTSRMTSLGAVWAEGVRVATKETGEAGRELGVELEGGVDGLAALRSARAQRSGGYLLCHALLYAMTVMWGLWYIYSIVLECIHVL